VNHARVAIVEKNHVKKEELRRFGSVFCAKIFGKHLFFACTQKKIAILLA
jgi:hypothetical protein